MLGSIRFNQESIDIGFLHNSPCDLPTNHFHGFDGPVMDKYIMNDKTGCEKQLRV